MTESFQHFSYKNPFLVATLAAMAGLLNVGAFLACQTFVTHTTGFATLFGAQLAALHFKEAFGMITVPLFFLFGSMISGFYVDREIENNRTPQYKVIFLLISFLMLLVFLLGEYGYFGHFGETQTLWARLIFISILCLAAGLQNAVTTSASQKHVRTTHLTGITTDLGIGLVRQLTTKNQEHKFQESKDNTLRIITISFFILGSAGGAFLFTHVGYWGFTLPTFIFITLYIFARKGQLSD